MIDLTTAPEVSYKRDYYGKVRIKKARWIGATDAEGRTLIFELTVSHHSSRKQFSAYVARLLASTDNGFTVEEYQPFRDLERLPSKPVARFSAKALDVAFDEASAALIHARHEARITRLLDFEPGE